VAIWPYGKVSESSTIVLSKIQLILEVIHWFTDL